jgi:hypothetical protein
MWEGFADPIQMVPLLDVPERPQIATAAVYESAETRHYCKWEAEPSGADAMDRVNAQTRSGIISRVRGRDTRMELAVRPVLEALGFAHQPKGIIGRPGLRSSRCKGGRIPGWVLLARLPRALQGA